MTFCITTAAQQAKKAAVITANLSADKKNTILREIDCASQEYSNDYDS